MMHPWNDACICFPTLSNYVILKSMQGWHFHRFKDPVYHNNFPHIGWLISWRSKPVCHNCFVSSMKIFMLVDRLHASCAMLCPPSPKLWRRSGDPLQNISVFKIWSKEKDQLEKVKTSLDCVYLNSTCLTFKTTNSFVLFELWNRVFHIFLCNQLLIPIAPMSEYWYRPKLSNWSDIKGLMLHLYKCYAGICGSWTFCFVLDQSTTLYPYQKSFLLAG